MAATKYYPSGGTQYYWTGTSPAPPGSLPTAEQSSAIPGGGDTVGTGVTGTDGGVAELLTSLDAAIKNIGAPSGSSILTTATTNPQRTFMGYGFRRVGAGTIGAGTWRFAAWTYESNTASNHYLYTSIYIYRVGTGVIGYIFDSNTAVGGSEFTGTAVWQVVSFTGSGITAQNGDYLIWELWAGGTQSMGTAYTFKATCFASTAFPTDAVNLDNTAGKAGWIEAPDALPDYSAGPATSMLFPRRDRRIVPLL